MRGFGNAMICVGAVIGAGFASGREIVSFFSRYGGAAPGLIALAVLGMTALCALLLRHPRRDGGWRSLMGGRRVGAAAEICVMLLMILTGGAMISAAGHMVALLWPNEWAYSVGAVGTLALAWRLTRASLRPLSWLSAGLTVLLLLCLCAAFTLPPETQIRVERGSPEVLSGAARAVAYASMNLTLAIGVVCRMENAKGTPLWFGGMMALLLSVSHALYARHPSLFEEAFPLVKLLAAFGRAGFGVSAVLMYLSVFTSLTAVLCALRSGLEAHLPRVAAIPALGLPLAVSCIGFSGIVDGLYAPAGLVCLACIYGPLSVKNRVLDKSMENE